MIKLTKTGSNDTDYCNSLLMQHVHLFNDEIYDKAIKLMKDTGGLNIAVEEEEEIDNNNSNDKKPKNIKELIQNTINNHNGNNTKKAKDIKKDDIQNTNYDSKNHIISKSNRRHQDIRLEHNFF